MRHTNLGQATDKGEKAGGVLSVQPSLIHQLIQFK